MWQRLSRFFLLFATGLMAGFVATGADAAVTDEAWLARIGYGATPQALRELKEIGREAYLHKQLNPPESDNLPPQVASYVEKLDALKVPVRAVLANDVETLREIRRAQKQKSENVSKMRMARNRTLQQYRQQASERSVLRAAFSPWQLREQLTWFWFNHFNVFMVKGTVGYTVGDYENTIRAHVLGNFRDMLEATLKHPAMLVYLDNTASRKDKPNENYARELMELHTLGVDGGYTQEDVQALARILTGVRVHSSEKPPKLPGKWQSSLVQEGAFIFDPRQHDFSDKRFLGHKIKGSGWAEVEQVLDILASHPSTARHIARQLSTYLIGDAPPARVVDGAAKVFLDTKGDLKAVVQYIVESDAFTDEAGKQFKSPMQYAISAVRTGGIKNPRRVVNLVRGALTRSGQSLYGRLTPDGYPLGGQSWVSTGQMANRIAFAESITGVGKSSSNPPPAKKKLFLQLAGPGFMYR